MKSFTKKLIGMAGIFGITGSVLAQSLSPLTANITTDTLRPYLLSTNRASVYSVMLQSSYPCVVYLYDSDNTNNIPTSAASGAWGTNFVNAAYPSIISYSTNIVTSYIGGTGYTNSYTNRGIWSVTVTNAAGTNAMVPLGVYAVGANLPAAYSTDMVFVRGIVAICTTNVSLIIGRTSGQ